MTTKKGYKNDNPVSNNIIGNSNGNNNINSLSPDRASRLIRMGLHHVACCYEYFKWMLLSELCLSLTRKNSFHLLPKGSFEKMFHFISEQSVWHWHFDLQISPSSVLVAKTEYKDISSDLWLSINHGQGGTTLGKDVVETGIPSWALSLLEIREQTYSMV